MAATGVDDQAGVLLHRLHPKAGYRSAGSGAVGFHQKTRAAPRDVRNYGGAPMHLRNRSQIDGEGEHDLLAFAQTEIGGLNKDASGAQIHRLAKPSAALGHGDINSCTCTVPRMQAAFHSRPLTHVGSI